MPASRVGYVPEAQGGLPHRAPRTVRTGYAYQPRPYGTYRVPWHPRRLPPAARRRERRLPAHARAHGRARRPSSAGQPAGRPRLQLLGRPALCTRRLAATRAGRLSAAAPSGHPWRNVLWSMLHASSAGCTGPVHFKLVCLSLLSVLTYFYFGSRVAYGKSSVDISPLVQNAARTERVSTRVPRERALLCSARPCAVACLQSARRL